MWPTSIRAINDLPRAQKLAIYQSVIPDWVYEKLGINRADHTIRGTEVVHIRCPAHSNVMELSICGTPESDERLLYLHMGDTFTSQLIVLLVVINDPQSPRYNVDVDEHGQPTQLGVDSRHVPEERRAMQAGLAPGQVRRGMRVFRTVVPDFERFVTRMGHDLFFIEPLFYHNAITFERYGFAYSRGIQKMKIIHQEFSPGERLHAQLDGSTPFRSPDAWRTISGRSWALHDGILGEPFTGVQMYKRVGVDAGICTFPDARW
ncbi:MAG: hypothetical protein K8S97_14400 [Anaerolineae bacterium]|nr:hypothetical protein [Anaerolineae bacterium]